MKPIRFLPFLAACLGLSAYSSAAVYALPEAPRERRKFRSKRDRMTKTFFGRRWSWNTPHIGAKQAEKLGSGLL